MAGSLELCHKYLNDIPNLHSLFEVSRPLARVASKTDRLLSTQKIADTEANMIKSPAKYFVFTCLLVICFATYSESVQTPRRNLEPEDTHNLFEHAATNETGAEICERRGNQGRCDMNTHKFGCHTDSNGDCVFQCSLVERRGKCNSFHECKGFF